MRCKDCGNEVVPYNHPYAPEAHPPYVCRGCGRFYMRSEAEALPSTDATPQKGVHSPVEPSWHQWEPGHTGKAIVTDTGHVYSWSNGTLDAANPDDLHRPNGKYLPHASFMRQYLGMDALQDSLPWHYFELDPDGVVVEDGIFGTDYSGALDALERHHPALNTEYARKASPSWRF